MRSRIVFLLLALVQVRRVRPIKINPCCPEGEIYTLDLQLGCTPYHGEIPLWTEEGEQVEFTKRTGDTFKCDESRGLVNTDRVYGPNVEVRINLTTRELDVTDLNGTVLGSYSFGNFCGTNIINDNGELDSGYYVCYDDGNEEPKLSVFYPLGIFVSASFILATIILYFMLDSLKRTLFQKITLGFLFNVFFCYLLLGIDDSLDYGEKSLEHGSLDCKIYGYIIHHTFLAISFWMTAMALNMTRSVVMQESKSSRSLLAYIHYGQGTPTLITIFIFLMDNFQPRDIPLPNMGEYQCLVGSEFSTEKSFFQSSLFLYFYSIMIVLITFNIVCLLVTAMHLHKNYKTNSSDDLDKFWTIVKLSVILGVPWILEFLYDGLDWQYGYQISHLLAILPKIITGFLIFLSLICKPAVWSEIKKSYSRRRAASLVPEYFY